MLKKLSDKRENFVYLFFVILSVLGLFIIVFSLMQSISAIDSNSDYDGFDEAINASEGVLLRGKNIVVFDDYVLVSELVSKNDFIESVSYYDSFTEKSIGYVNFLGGIGKDFLIVPQRSYEIFVSQEGKLAL